MSSANVLDAARLSALLFALALVATPGAWADPKIDFDIPSGALPKTVVEFYRQSHKEVMFRATPDIEKTVTAAVKGDFEPWEALQRMLEGTALTMKIIEPNSAIVNAAPPSAKSAEDSIDVDDDGKPVVTISASQLTGQGAVTVIGSLIHATGTGAAEVLVAGTALAGPSTFTQLSAPESDYATNHGSLYDLPQNSSNAPRLDFGVNGNRQYGSTVNFRGLGVGNTLVLVNGQRQPGAGLDGSFVDITTVPCAAVERVEIHVDGSSDLFGTDAISVLNFVMKDDFEGANTTVQFDTSQGGERGRVVSQLFGTHWATGRALLAYQYSDVTPLLDPHRATMASLWGFPVSEQLFPQIRSNIVYASGSQSVASDVELFADGRFAQRGIVKQGVPDSLQPGDPAELLTASTDTHTHMGTLGARFGIGRSGWLATLSGSSGRQSLSTNEYSGQRDMPDRATSGVDTVRFVSDGPVGQLPAGSAKLALGVERRQETLRHDVDHSDGRIASERYSRSDNAAFAEMWAPLAGDRSYLQSRPSLTLTLIGRLNDYSDFGHSFNPMARLRWTPLQSLQFRMSWATFFRPPALGELHESGQITPTALLLPDSPARIDRVPVLAIGGGNPHLRPETALTRILEMKIEPKALSGLSVLLRYYAIDVWNRIARPGEDGPWDILANTAEWGTFITRQPTRAQIAAACSSEEPAGGLANCLDSAPGAIVDYRLTNLASTEVRGLDMEVTEAMDSPVGRLWFRLEGDELTRFAQSATPTSPAVEIANTVGNPQAHRFRAAAAWRPLVPALSGLQLEMSANYTGAYRNPASSQAPRVDPWTTVDMSVRYVGPEGPSLFAGMEFELSIDNALAKAPPFVSGPLGYDANNVQPVGRGVSFSVKKRW